MPDEADELLGVQVDNLLRVLLVRQVGQDNLSVVRREALVRHQRVINHDILFRKVSDIAQLVVLVFC